MTFSVETELYVLPVCRVIHLLAALVSTKQLADSTLTTFKAIPQQHGLLQTASALMENTSVTVQHAVNVIYSA